MYFFFAIWLFSTTVYADPSGQAQAQKAANWAVYVAGCSKPTIPPMSPVEAAAVAAMCIDDGRPFFGN